MTTCEPSLSTQLDLLTMNNPSPYLITGPALISFSGGRSSGYMLKHILDTHGGALPEDVHVAFANTGKEMPETLDFVQECSERWSVPIVWLEYDEDAANATKVVNHNSASRNGEPFAALCRKKQFLPNPVTRFCTVELKIRRMHKWMDRQGYERWNSVIGFRADEGHRAKRSSRESTRQTPVYPMVASGVTKMDVKAFWDAQPFDLRLENVNGTAPLGNCDLCFLKGQTTVSAIMRQQPELARWWMEMEMETRASKPSGALFRQDRPSYAALYEAAMNQGDMFDGWPEGIEGINCTACHD